MTSVMFLIVALVVIPLASLRFGVDSRDLRASEVRSLVS